MLKLARELKDKASTRAGVDLVSVTKEWSSDREQRFVSASISYAVDDASSVHYARVNDLENETSWMF